MIRALHLASFDGNIGDIANHKGFWNLFSKYVSKDFSVDYLEIREFYKSWNLRVFDEGFIDLVNRYDLLVIGGGNFFDVKWSYSKTGTTLNLSKSLLEKIHVPIVFNGLGVDYSADLDPNGEIRERFNDFLEYITEKTDNIVVSVRNDDSVNLLKKYFSPIAAGNIYQIPDGGFFTSAAEYTHPEVPCEKKIVAINVAKDRMLDRWGTEKGYLNYCNEFAEFINLSLNNDEKLHIIFVPHIPTDIQAINDVISHVKDYYCRRRITIAPYINGVATPGDYLIDLYRKSAVTVGMRYHANICSIAMRTPTIGIVTLDKHVQLYKNIGMESRVFDVNAQFFGKKLCDKVMNSIAQSDVLAEENDRLVRELERASVKYYEKISRVLLK